MRKKALATPLLGLVLLLASLAGCGRAAAQPSVHTPSPPPVQTAAFLPAADTPARSSPSPTPTPAATPEPEPSVPSPAPETAVSTAPPKTEVQTTYILNTNTGKFHKPTCSSVDQMKESNKQPFSGTRDQAIARGYSPCGRCHP